jgi:hypothetical protein
MKPQTSIGALTAVIMLSFGLFASCSKSGDAPQETKAKAVPQASDSSTPVPEPKPIAPHPKAAPSHFAVKGLSVGMTIDAALENLKQRLVNYRLPLQLGGLPLEFSPVVDNKQSVASSEQSAATDSNNQLAALAKISAALDLNNGIAFEFYAPSGKLAMMYTFVKVTANDQKSVTKIYLSGPVVDELFGATNMEAKEYAQAFLNAYNISELTANDDGKGWHCVTSDGTRITLSEDKELTLEKVLSAQEQKSKFD